MKMLLRDIGVIKQRFYMMMQPNNVSLNWWITLAMVNKESD